MGCSSSSAANATYGSSVNATPSADIAPPKVYLYAISQPSRSVEMLLAMGGVSFENAPVDLMAGERCEPNPTGAVPYIEDAAFGISMGEGMAILVHLCETRPALKAYYPSEPKMKAAVNYWLHWNHTGARLSTLFLRSLLTDDVAAQKAAFFKMLPQHVFMEQALKRQGTPFFAGEAVTIADLALIPEIDQLDVVFDTIFGVGLFPLLEAWRARMGGLSAYAENPGLKMLKEVFAPMLTAKATALKEAVGVGIADAVAGLAKETKSVVNKVDENKDGKITPAEVSAFLTRLVETEEMEEIATDVTAQLLETAVTSAPGVST